MPHVERIAARDGQLCCGEVFSYIAGTILRMFATILDAVLSPK